MNRTRRVLTVLFFFLAVSLFACTQPEQSAPGTTASPGPGGTAGQNPTWTPTVAQNCSFNWATQPLPELSGQVQQVVNKAGLTGITARAEAYGENCFDPKTGQAVFFTAMEADFRFVVTVKSLADKSLLGKLLEQLLSVVDNFPPAVTHTPQAGYIGVTFQAGTDNLNLWFTIDQGKSARAQGLHNADLLVKLEGK